MVKFVSLLLIHLVLETIHPVQESQVNVNISGQARGETTDETGLLMISEITSCLSSDNHLNQSPIFAGNELVCYFHFPECRYLDS